MPGRLVGALFGTLDVLLVVKTGGAFWVLLSGPNIRLRKC
jgi:hypothetical protein